MHTLKTRKLIDDETAATVAALRPLIQQARARGLWLVLTHGNVWVSPGELEHELHNGNLVHAPINWELADPAEELHRLEEESTRAANAVFQFGVRMVNARQAAAPRLQEA